MSREFRDDAGPPQAVSRAPADAWAALRARPWRFLCSVWPVRSLAYLASTVPVGAAVLVALLLVLGIGALTTVIVVGLMVLASVPLVATVVAETERVRLRLVLPSHQNERREGGRSGVGAGLVDRLRTWRTLSVSWSEIGYAVLLAALLWLIDGAVLMFTIILTVVLLLAPLLVRSDAIGEVAGWDVDTTPEAWAAFGIGVVAALVSAYAITALACGQAALARLLLDPPEARLVAAVNRLRRSRAGLVDAFEAERRRIERDLHDGAQQRLVALTMTLGRAELELDKGPALDLVTKAHALADDALGDLRATVRGIHPQVLTDHGLTAAIHELAGRSPVPVDTTLHLDGRLPTAVETAAYFMVSEALTNIARHASATLVRIDARVTGGTATVTVVDDGSGGADPAAGTGLAGLAARIDAVDGVLEIASPPGGPTTLRMTCPTT